MNFCLPSLLGTDLVTIDSPIVESADTSEELVVVGEPVADTVVVEDSIVMGVCSWSIIVAVVAAIVVVGGTEAICVAVGSRSMIRYEWSLR